MAWCRYPKIMSRNDRRTRHDNIVAAFRRGEPQEKIAERFGLTLSWVRTIARKAGALPVMKRGRTRIWRDCPPHLISDYDMLVREKKIPARKAIEMLGGKL